MGSDNLIYYINLFNLSKEYKNRIRLWRNQSFVREKMVNKNIISKEEHDKFINNLTEEDMYYLFFLNSNAFGFASLKKIDNIYYEYGHYLINKKDLNSGLGIIIEYVIHNKLFKNNKNLKSICKTKISNEKVINMHKKFGYKDKKNIKINNENYLVQEINYDDWESNKQNIRNIIEKIFKINLDEVREWKKN